MTSGLRTAIVGAGLMGRWHARAVRRAGSRVAAVVDPREDAAARLAGRTGARVYRGLDAALGEVDVVHVCTPTASHVAVVEQALAAGCHVLVEKPLAPTVDDTARLLDRAAAAGRLLCPVHQFVFQRGFAAACGDAVRLGPLRHVDATICSAGGAGHPADVVRDIAWGILPHPLSLLVRLFGPEPIEWRAAIATGAGDLRIAGAAGPCSIGIVVSLTGRPPVNELRLTGTAGTIYADLFHGFAVVDPGRVSRGRKILRPFSRALRTGGGAAQNLAVRILRGEPAYPGLTTLVSAFHHAAAHGGAAPLSPGETLAVARHIQTLEQLAGA